MFANGDSTVLVREAIEEMPVSQDQSPSHIYAGILRTAIHRGLVLDNLHLGDVLIALRNAGFSVSPRTGLISCGETAGLRRTSPSVVRTTRRHGRLDPLRVPENPGHS